MEKKQAPTKKVPSQRAPSKKAASKKIAQTMHKAPEPTPQYVTKDMTMGDIVSLYPEAIPTILEHGLHCIGCHVSPWETIEQGSMGHGMSEEEFHTLLKEINDIAIEKHAKQKSSPAPAQNPEPASADGLSAEPSSAAPSSLPAEPQEH